MFVVSKRNIILPGPNGEKFHMPRDYMGSLPAWAEGSDYLKALVKDGKVIVTESGTDKDIAAKEKKPKKGKKPAEPSVPSDASGENADTEEGSCEDQSDAPDVPGE